MAHAIDPSLEVLGYNEPLAGFWASAEDARLSTAAAATEGDLGNAWERIAAEVGSGKTRAECEARWKELGDQGSGGGATGDKGDAATASGSTTHLADEQARAHLAMSIRHEGDINVNSPARGAHAQLYPGDSALDLSISPATAMRRLPPLPDLSTLMLAAESVTEKHGVLHTTASPAIRIGPLNGAEDDEDIARKHWRAEDDAKLLQLVEKYGPRNWARLAKTLGTGRSGPSCCARWCRLAGSNRQPGDYVAPNPPNAPPPPDTTITDTTKTAYATISKGKRSNWTKWTPAEDEQLANLVHEHGGLRWPHIAQLMPKHVETGRQRTADSCHARWVHHVSKRPQYEGWEAEAMERLATEEGEDDDDGKDLRLNRKMNKIDEMKQVKARAQANAASSRWMPSDDAQLIKLKHENPKQTWAWLGNQMEPKRSGDSSRARWAQHIAHKLRQLTVKSAETVSEEDELRTPAASPEVGDIAAECSTEPSPAPVEKSLEAPAVGAAAAAAIEAGLDVPVDPALVEPAPSPIVPAPTHGPARRTQPWTTAEEIRLRELVATNGTSDWSRTANELGTGRSVAGVSARWVKLKATDKRKAERAAASASKAPLAPSTSDTGPLGLDIHQDANFNFPSLDLQDGQLEQFLEGLAPTPPIQQGNFPITDPALLADEHLMAEPYMSDLIEGDPRVAGEGAQPVADTSRMAEPAEVTSKKGAKRAVPFAAEASRKSQRLKRN